jgi:Spy/CpxP family protein refolding chaperone
MQRGVLQLLVAAAALSCAHAPEGAPSPPPPRPAFHSSVAAVLGQREAIALTEEQVTRLWAIDDALQAINAELRAQSPSRRSEAPRDRPINTPSPTADQAPPGDSPHTPGSMPGMGSGGRGMRGGGRGMGAGGGGGRRGPGSDEGARRLQALREQQDNADTKAYLDAEAELTEAQRPAARKAAELYRAQLFDWRAAGGHEGSDEAGGRGSESP